MKNILILTISLIIIMSFIGCGNKEEKESKLGVVLAGKHELRKMSEATTINGKIVSTFFLFAGGTNTSMETNKKVTFAWKRNDGTYGINTVPIERCRIKFVRGTEVPYIKFRWRKCGRSDVQQAIKDEFIVYVLIVCDKKDWKIDVNFPLEKKKTL